jgi:uncharacterized protein with PQ loop repeat
MITPPSLATNALIVTGESFWIFSISAQLRRLIKTRNTQGLSAPTQTLNTAGNVSWATYFTVNHLWFPFFTNVTLFFLGATTLGYILSNRRQFAKGLLAILIVAPVTSYALVRYPAAGGWIGMVYNWIASTPWLYKVVTSKKVTGLSKQSLYFGLGASLCVFVYGVIIRAWPLLAVGAQGFVYQLIILRFCYRYLKRSR